MIGSGHLSRLFHTVRHLRGEQIAYRLYYRLARPLVTRQALASITELSRRAWVRPWVAPLIAPRSHIDQGVFEFLGERGRVETAGDWSAVNKTKLWLYNLHYLDDLNAVDADARPDQQGWLIQRWIDDNPPLAGHGWEPYPLSLRIGNLVKWCARQTQVSPEWLVSIGRQAQALAVQEERHILANHLFANGKALTFAGAFFSGDQGGQWLKGGLRILDREISEQFLPDGGHFELSPMYHSTLLWDMCDLVNLAERSAIPELLERAAAWRGVIERGLAWLESMCHPDGEISFFNDAAFGIAPQFRQIKAYAGALGCLESKGLTEALSCTSYTYLRDTGYIVVLPEQGGKALLDVAAVGPAYQPGHAHADTLGFELSLFGQRVLVNSGTSRYGEDTERLRQRSTAAHNTVEIDGEDSSEVWAGFRVARRARPSVPEIWRELGMEGKELRIRCAHDGYRRLPGHPIHQRQWAFAKGRLRMIDSLSGQFRKAVCRFYLHPDVQVVGNRELHLQSGHRLLWSVFGGMANVVSSTWHPQFGASVPSHCIEIPFESAELIVDFSWE